MSNPKDTGVEHLVVDPEKVPGDASLEFKRQVVELWPFHRADPDNFASSIGARLELTEISIVPKREDPQVMEARIAAEIDVRPEMLNDYGFTHGGCIAYLIDLCTSMPAVALELYLGKEPKPTTVSQSLTIQYLGPSKPYASLVTRRGWELILSSGDRLRLVSSTVVVGGRVRTLYCEVWAKNRHRLVATATHVKFEPSPSKL